MAKEKSAGKTQKKAQGKVASKAPKKVEKKVQPNLSDNPILFELINQITGEHGYTVVKTLSKEELTDDDVAKRTGIRINLVRRILYDLYDNRVVSYRRIRDENSGWYIYYWRVEPERALDYVNTNRRLLLQKLEEQLTQERTIMYFNCNDGCPKLPFDLAAENDFKCPRCGGRLELYDNSSVITSLEHKVQSLRQQLVGS